jgi:hydrogenase expression/formation protein HypE
MTGPNGFSPNCPAPLFGRDVIDLAHGGGGRLTRQLIETVFRPAFAEAPDDLTHDGAVLDFSGGQLAFTTDTYVVRPLFFPGGDIGSLAVFGTVNDLAMCGAEPLWLSVGLVLEEGFAIADLRRIVDSMGAAARLAGVHLVTGDTKVVERGKGDGLYVNTSGIGRVVVPSPVSPQRVRPGDAVLVSGDLGRHGIAIMAARDGLGFETALISDCAALAAPVRQLIDAGIPLHCLRDLTRGGLATALVEIALAGAVTIRLDEAAIPVCDAVRGACEILGLDPLYVANEGRFVALVPAADARFTLDILRALDPAAALVGRVEAAGTGGTLLLDTIGGTRALDLLTGEQLPRIC